MADDLNLLRRILQVEEEHQKRWGTPYWEWSDLPVEPNTLKKLVLKGLVKKLGRRWYCLADREKVKKMVEEAEVAQKIHEVSPPPEKPVEVPPDLFDVIEGYDDLKEFFRLSLKSERPVHCLMVGPPGTAKSLFLMELERLGGVFVTAGTTTKVGIRNIIFEYLPRILLIDEIDKIQDSKDLSALLTWMESGRIVIAKHQQYEQKQGRGWVFAAANSTRGLPPELLDRFQVFHLQPYTEEQFKRIVVNYLRKRMGVEEDLAKFIAEKVGSYTLSVREAIRVASLAKTKEEVERVVGIIQKYRG
jgi:Holliday junction DNA helicase RuvB